MLSDAVRIVGDAMSQFLTACDMVRFARVSREYHGLLPECQICTKTAWVSAQAAGWRNLSVEAFRFPEIEAAPLIRSLAFYGPLPLEFPDYPRLQSLTSLTWAMTKQHFPILLPLLRRLEELEVGMDDATQIFSEERWTTLRRLRLVFFKKDKTFLPLHLKAPKLAELSLYTWKVDAARMIESIGVETRLSLRSLRLVNMRFAGGRVAHLTPSAKNADFHCFPQLRSLELDGKGSDIFLRLGDSAGLPPLDFLRLRGLLGSLSGRAPRHLEADACDLKVLSSKEGMKSLSVWIRPWVIEGGLGDPPRSLEAVTITTSTLDSLQRCLPVTWHSCVTNVGFTATGENLATARTWIQAHLPNCRTVRRKSGFF